MSFTFAKVCLSFSNGKQLSARADKNQDKLQVFVERAMERIEN